MKTQMLAFLGYFTLSAMSWAQEPMIGVDAAADAEAVKQYCSGCSSRSILAITNRTGAAALCITSTTNNTELRDDSYPRLYYMYNFKSSCKNRAWVSVKVGGKWYDNVGEIRPGSDAMVSLLYQASNGPTPTVIMFCPDALGRKDDIFCQSGGNRENASNSSEGAALLEKAKTIKIPDWSR